jgi:DNA-binding transcriptional ArsR family regulator
MPRQRLHYHLKILRAAGLVAQIDKPASQAGVEKYYRSVAENFSSPLLKELISPLEEDLSKQELRSQTLRELSLTLAEQARMDLQQPTVIRKMASLSPPFQHVVFLTPEQERETAERFQVIKNDILQLSEQNQHGARQEDIVSVRYTLLITPSYTGEDEP